jgi:hypothetical protein
MQPNQVCVCIVDISVITLLKILCGNAHCHNTESTNLVFINKCTAVNLPGVEDGMLD